MPDALPKRIIQCAIESRAASPIARARDLLSRGSLAFEHRRISRCSTRSVQVAVPVRRTSVASPSQGRDRSTGPGESFCCGSKHHSRRQVPRLPPACAGDLSRKRWRCALRVQNLKSAIRNPAPLHGRWPRCNTQTNCNQTQGNPGKAFLLAKGSEYCNVVYPCRECRRAKGGEAPFELSARPCIATTGC